MDVLFNPDFKIYQKEILDELWFMRQNVNKEGFLARYPNAPKGKNDDLIIAGGGAMYIARELPDRWDLMRQQAKVKIDENDPYERYVRNFKQSQSTRRDAVSVAKGNGRYGKKKFSY